LEEFILHVDLAGEHLHALVRLVDLSVVKELLLLFLLDRHLGLNDLLLERLPLGSVPEVRADFFFLHL